MTARESAQLAACGQALLVAVERIRSGGPSDRALQRAAVQARALAHGRRTHARLARLPAKAVAVAAEAAQATADRMRLAGRAARAAQGLLAEAGKLGG